MRSMQTTRGRRAAGRTLTDELNSAQQAAATYGAPDARGAWRSGPLLVIAGAGTGKTSTLAHRVAHLVLHGVAPERILLVTFSRRAADELLRRARRIVGAAVGGVADSGPAVARLTWAGTFHSIANRLLRRYAAPLGLDPGFSVIDRSDAADLMDLARQALGLSGLEKRFPRKDTCLAIYSHCVNTQRALEATLAGFFPWCAEWREELRRLFGRYVEMKLAQQVLDFDDLLLYWHALVREPELAQEVGSRYEHVLVDEYQDTNALQAEILLAMKPTGAGVCVVGDDAQAIYSFRAATVENILDFPLRFDPPARVITLEENYRSSQPILDAANALIGEAARGYAKRLRSCRASAARPRYVSALDEQAQADYVIARILEAREQGTLLRRQAVLFRSAHHSDVLEVELVRRNIPYVKYGGLKFLEAAHVKDVLAVLRWADNPRHQLAAFRTLQLLPGVGPAGAERCLALFAAHAHEWRALASHGPARTAAHDWEALCRLLSELAHPERPWPGQMQLVRQWYEPHLMRLYEAAPARAGDLEQLERISSQFGTRERFLTELALDPPRASGDYSGAPLLDEDYLVLSTVHSAKGQEWDRVHVLHVCDGSFPSEFAAGNADQIEEERRLLYVAMTRARHELDLIAPVRYYVTQQTRHGEAYVHGARSRFLAGAVMQHFEALAHSDDFPPAPSQPVRTASPRIDVAAQLRKRWA
jgi:DNA helicase II / ATP-dependent DNA helicase PcrA